MTPMDLETWFTTFFQVPEDEIEPFANLAFVYQEGNDNSSEQIQQGENNRAYVYQYGEGNYVQQWQNGWGNWAGAYQVGNRNNAVIHQVGTSNWAGTYQLGDANTARIEQSGSKMCIRDRMTTPLPFIRLTTTTRSLWCRNSFPSVPAEMRPS